MSMFFQNSILLIVAGILIVRFVKNIVEQVMENKKKSQWVCAMVPVIMLQEDKERSYRRTKNGPWYHPQRIVCEGRNPVDGSNAIFDTGMKEIRYNRYVSQGSMVPIYVNPEMPEQYFIDYENAKDPIRYQYGMPDGQYATDEDYAREAQRMAMEMANNPQMMQQMEEQQVQQQQMQQQAKRSADSITYNTMYGDSLEPTVSGKDIPGPAGWIETLFMAFMCILMGSVLVYIGWNNLVSNFSTMLMMMLVGGVFIVAGFAAIVYKIKSIGKTPEQLAAEQPQLTEAEKERMQYMTEADKLKFIFEKIKETDERNKGNGY